MQKFLTTHAVSIGNKVLPLFIISIHFSPPATLITFILLVIAWLCSGYPRQSLPLLKQSPFIFYALILFLLLGLSVCYSAAPYDKAFATLGKYRELLLPLILLPFLSSQSQCRRGETVLLITLITTLLISTAGYLDWLSPQLTNRILKNRITHSLFMAFLGFYSLHKIHRDDERKWMWWTLLGLVTMNLFVMSDGRTGQLVFLALGVLFLLQRFSLKTGVFLSVTLLLGFMAFLWSSPYAVRFWQGIHESIAFFNHSGNLENTSMGDRLRFWNSALRIIADAPWLGEGVGGFPYAFHIAFPTDEILTNPHNEFLLITTQIGIPGLLIFLTLLFSILKHSFHCTTPQRQLLQGLWLMLCFSCLFNSSILDHSEGHWFMTVIMVFSAYRVNDHALQEDTNQSASKPAPAI